MGDSQRHKDVTLRIKNIQTFDKVKLKKIKLKLDIFTLDQVLAFLYKPSKLKTRKALNNFYKLFSNIDEQWYERKPDLNSRFRVIVETLRLQINERLESENGIKSELLDILGDDELCIEVINNLDTLTIGYEESKKLIQKIDDRLQFGYVITIKEIMQDFLECIEDEEYQSYKQISEDLFMIASSIVNIKRNTNSLDSDDTFSLDADKFEEAVTAAVHKLQDRMRIFRTGLVGLNTFLAPGYMSKRLYMYLAFPGGGKSQLLLKSALDIKRYNPHIKAKDPTKRPCILYITMENSVEETIERIFNMCVSPDDIRNYTPNQVIKKLRDGGKLTLTDDNDINIIIKYYPNRSIDTNDLYGIIQDIEDDGHELIAFILDYVKRIRPAEKAATEKEELKNITNELKNLGAHFDCTVITAQQLNRVAASVVDAAIQAKKEDVTKLVGRDGIAGAWEIIENSDWVCILNQEVKKDTEELFMTFKLLKRRYRSSDDDETMRRLQYFNHPYEPGNEIRLIDDVDLERPLMVQSLSTQMISFEDSKRGKKNTVSNQTSDPLLITDQPYDTQQKLEFEPFDSNQSIQFAM